MKVILVVLGWIRMWTNKKAQTFGSPAAKCSAQFPLMAALSVIKELKEKAYHPPPPSYFLPNSLRVKCIRFLFALICFPPIPQALSLSVM